MYIGVIVIAVMAAVCRGRDDKEHLNPPSRASLVSGRREGVLKGRQESCHRPPLPSHSTGSQVQRSMPLPLPR
jgi:hypothetical protein